MNSGVCRGEEGEAWRRPRGQRKGLREQQQRGPFLGNTEPICESPEHSFLGNSPPGGCPRVVAEGNGVTWADMASKGRLQPDPGPELPSCALRFGPGNCRATSALLAAGLLAF